MNSPYRHKLPYYGATLAGLVAALSATAWLYHHHTTQAAYLLDRGRAALKQDDWKRMEQCAAELERRGYLQHAHLLRAEGWLGVGRGGDPTQAPAVLRRALAEIGRIQDDGTVGIEGTVVGGECLARLGERRAAAQALETLVRRHPAEREAHRWLAAIYMDLNSPAQAVEHFRAWGALDPHAGLPFRWAGFFLKDYHNYTEAADAYREALRRHLEPAARAAVLRELAETLIEGPSDFRGALQTLDEGPPDFQDEPAVVLLRARCHWGLGETDAAGHLADQALQTAAQLTEARCLRAQVLLQKDRPRDALHELKDAMRSDPHDLPARQLLMQVYRRLGDAKRAAEEEKRLTHEKSMLDRLTQLHTQAARIPWDARPRCEIAALCLERNRLAEAQTWVQAALACDPQSAAAHELQARLATREGNQP